MTLPSPDGVTQLLLDWSNGDKAALDKLMPLVYEELRRVAHHYMRQERPGHTLQTTAIVNEAYIHLINQREVQWQNRTHFFGIASLIMRRILTGYARSRQCAKRGGSAQQVALEEAMLVSEERVAEMVALDDALNSLALIDERKSQIVEMRFFGGLSIEETATVLGVSPTTVKDDLNLAKAWLRREIGGAKPK